MKISYRYLLLAKLVVISIFSILSFKGIAQTNAIGLPLKARAVIDGISYKAIVNKDTSVSIVSGNGKSARKVHLSLDYSTISSFKFEDFDGDGFKDIFIEFFSNLPGDCDVYLYNPSRKNFTHVTDIGRYPSAIKIIGTKYYYSYHRSGCADEDWDSDLFFIKDFKAIRIGNISGNACDENNPGVFISRIIGNNKKMVEKFNVHILEKYKSQKWGFIDSYWKKNYRKFV